MTRDGAVLLAAFLPTLAALTPAFGGDEPSAPLPEGVREVWDMSRAYRETTPTRERICINGLWRWQPAAISDDKVPAGNWGHFKVPGCWPGITDYLQKDFQTVHAHPSWKNEQLGNLSAAWYERTVSVPEDWAGRRLSLAVGYLNSYAEVFVDGSRRGELRFPGGELELTGHVRPGGTNRLSLLDRKSTRLNSSHIPLSRMP